MQLYIGNKNYSSWSLRPWLLMKQAGIPFEESEAAPRAARTTRRSRRRCCALAPSGRGAGADRRRLRGLGHAGDRRVPGRALSRQAPLAARRRSSAPGRAASAPRCTRASARCAAPVGMNIEAAPARGRRAHAARDSPRCARDLKRIDAMWSEALEAQRRAVPVRRVQHRRRVLRAGLHARAHLRPAAAAAASAPTCERMLALPAMQAWERDALAEHDFLDATSRTGRTPEIGRARAKQQRAAAAFST